MQGYKLLKNSPYYFEIVVGLLLNNLRNEDKITYLLLNMEPRCDVLCRRCFIPSYRKNLNLDNALTLDESKEVIRKAKLYGAKCLEISGECEPTINDNLPNIIEYANSIDLLTTLITNGHNLTKHEIELYKENNVTLVFSHYSLDKKRYEADNQTKGTFDKKMQNLETAIDIYSDTIEKSNGIDVHRLAIHTTLQKDNIEDIFDIRKYCTENDIFFSIAPLAQIGNAIYYKDMKLDKEILLNGKCYLIENIPNLLSDETIIHSKSAIELFGREVCGTCLYGLNIGYDGSLLLDVHAPVDLNIGNVRENSFYNLIRIQRIITEILFNNIKGFCPVRDPNFPELFEIIKNSIKI